MALSISEIKSGQTIILDGQVFIVIEHQHVKPGKGAAFLRTRLKNITTDAVMERTFRASDNVQEAYVEEKKLVFQYRAGNTFHFMNTLNYEEISVSQEQIEHEIPYLKDNLEVNILYFQGKFIKMIVPTFINLDVRETEPGLRGDTARQALKSATLETGLVVQVPLFINQGDKLKIDTRTGTYVERV